MKKTFRVALLVCALFLLTSVAAFAETATDYSGTKAVNFAKTNLNKRVGDEIKLGKDDCIGFASACAQAGGIPKDKNRDYGYTVEQYIKYALENGYAELKKVDTEFVEFYGGGGADYVSVEKNKGKLAVGDIVVYKCTNAKCPKPWFHVSVCAPSSNDGSYQDGYYRCYAHNTTIDNKPITKINCSQCKADKSTMEFYALHFTSKANGYSAYNAQASNIKAVSTAYNQLKVTWDKVDSAAGYNVYMTASNGGVMEKIAETTETSFIFDVDKDNYAKTFYFMVRPNKTETVLEEGFEFSNSGKASATVSAATTCGKTSKITPKLTGYRDISFSWKAVPGAAGYYVYYKPAGSSKWSWLCETTKTSASKKGLTAGKEYTLKVIAYMSSKNYSGKKLSEKYATAKITTMNKTTVNYVQKKDSKNVKVSVKDVPGESGYEISQSATKSGTTVVKTVTTDKGGVYTIPAKKGTTYYYKVRAFKVENGKKVYTPWSGCRSLKL